jgi:hypothetical protein
MVEKVTRFPGPVFGCLGFGDNLVDGHALAVDALGERAKDGGSGLVAFAYLWRRFGPPAGGSDPYKDLAAYALTTAEPDVFLRVVTHGAALAYGVGYFALEGVRSDFRNPRAENWREASPLARRVNQALFDSLRDLLRPVYIRDTAINIFGRLLDDDQQQNDAAEPSKYAGLGIDHEPLDRLLRGEEPSRRSPAKRTET